MGAFQQEFKPRATIISCPHSQNLKNKWSVAETDDGRSFWLAGWFHFSHQSRILAVVSQSA